MRRQLHDGQNLIRETLDRLRQSQEESEMNARKRDEIETRLAALEAEYEELIGESVDELFPVRIGAELGGNTQRKPYMMRRQAMSISQSQWLISRYDTVACGRTGADALAEQARDPIRREATSSRERGPGP